MTKELEALEYFYNLEDLQGGRDEYWKAYRTIETAVKRNIELEKENSCLKYLMKEVTYTFEKEDFTLEKLGKKLKVLDILKKKKVNVRALLKCCHREDGLQIYNNQCDDRFEMESKELTQEEYDLLKEVLRNED